MWGLPLNLWTEDVFEAIGKICGGLCSVDKDTLNCKELHWVCLELMSGDMRLIPRMISVIDQGKYFPVAISIEGDISVKDCNASEAVMEECTVSSTLIAPCFSSRRFPICSSRVSSSTKFQDSKFEFGRRTNLGELYDVRKPAMPCPSGFPLSCV